jgi:hypothetical protein
MSRLPYVLGPLVRAVYTGHNSYVLESGRYPVAALVNLKEWLAYLETKFPGIATSIERTDLARPYVRPTRRPPPAARRSITSRKRPRPTKPRVKRGRKRR